MHGKPRAQAPTWTMVKGSWKEETFWKEKVGDRHYHMEGLYSKMPSFSSYTEKNENIETRGEHGSGSVLRKVYFSSFDQSYVRFVNLETRSAFLHFLAVTKNSTDSYYNEIRFPVKCKGNSVFIHWSSHFSIFSFLFGSRRGRLWHRSSSSYKAQSSIVLEFCLLSHCIQNTDLEHSPQFFWEELFAERSWKLSEWVER